MVNPFVYNIDWGDGVKEPISGPAGGISRSHTYQVFGDFSIRASATDKDGGTSLLASSVFSSRLFVDNGDAAPGWQLQGSNWSPQVVGFEKDAVLSLKNGGNPAPMATWSFTGLTPGSYWMVYATWPTTIDQTSVPRPG